MILLWLFLPALVMFVASFWHQNKGLLRLFPWTNLLIFIGILQLFLAPKPVVLWHHLLVADHLNTWILLISSLASLAVTLSLSRLGNRVQIAPKGAFRFYRFFALFWMGLIIAILANHMGVFWIGLEMATLSTVYMIRTNQRPAAFRQAWNYMIVGTVAVSLVLFGIILIYAAAKGQLGEEAMRFDVLAASASHFEHASLFMLGFAITLLGLFLKMGFFPLNLWLPNIERAAFYPVAALFSGVLESAVMLGVFRFSDIAVQVNANELYFLVILLTLATLVAVSLMILRTHDLMRLFALSGVEHMALIGLFWVMDGKFAALLHLAAHTFMKPALFLSTGVLEQQGRRPIEGMLQGYEGWQGRSFVVMISGLMLGIIGLPPSPLFFSEILGLSAFFHSLSSLQASAISLAVLVPLAVVLYRFIEVWQMMRHAAPMDEKRSGQKVLYWQEWAAITLLVASTLALLTPPVWQMLEQIV